MTEKHLDDAIDRAVREMMSVDADAGFRARVFARLERSAPQTSSRWYRLAIAGAIGAAVVVAIVLSRPSAPTPERRELATTQSKPAAPAGSVPPRASGVQTGRAATADRRSPRPDASRRAVASSASVDNVTQQMAAGVLVAAVAPVEPPSGIEIAPLDPISPIAMEPLQSPPITPAAIVIAPLSAITDVQIAPLSPQLQRD